MGKSSCSRLTEEFINIQKLKNNWYEVDMHIKERIIAHKALQKDEYVLVLMFTTTIVLLQKNRLLGDRHACFLYLNNDEENQ